MGWEPLLLPAYSLGCQLYLLVRIRYFRNFQQSMSFLGVICEKKKSISSVLWLTVDPKEWGVLEDLVGSLWVWVMWEGDRCWQQGRQPSRAGWSHKEVILTPPVTNRIKTFSFHALLFLGRDSFMCIIERVCWILSLFIPESSAYYVVVSKERDPQNNVSSYHLPSCQVVCFLVELL